MAGRVMLEILYASRLRSVLRALGITRLLQIPKRIRGNRQAARWHKHESDTLDVEIAGISIVCPTNDQAEFSRAIWLTEDSHILEAIASRCRPGSIYWDVGANLGHYAAFISKAVGVEGRVYAFEPEPRVRNQLRDCVDINDGANVTIVPLGLSDRNGMQDFYAASDSASGTHSLIAQNPDGEKITIELVTGDNFVRLGNPCPNVVKIDVEGAELSVIHGMVETLKNPDLIAVICEIHFAVLAESGQSTAPTEIKRLLNDAGLTEQNWLDASHLIACRAASVI
jgi:FkbM family methyltransferase